MNIHGLKSNINKFTGVNCKNPKFGVQIAIFCPNLLYKDLLAKNLGPFRTRSLAAPVEAETLDPVPIPSSTSAACLRLLRRAKAPFDPPSIDPRDPIPLGNEFLLFFFFVSPSISCALVESACSVAYPRRSRRCGEIHGFKIGLFRVLFCSVCLSRFYFVLISFRNVAIICSVALL